MSLVAEAAADGVMVTLTTAGTLRLGGRPACVERWRDRIRTHRAAVVSELSAQLRDTQLAELRRLLNDLLWDAPEQVSATLEKAAKNIDASLPYWRTVWEDYRRLRELPGRENWPVSSGR